MPPNPVIGISGRCNTWFCAKGQRRQVNTPDLDDMMTLTRRPFSRTWKWNQMIQEFLRATDDGGGERQLEL